MTICRYPILVWEDYSGMFTAAPVEDLDDYMDADEEFAAVASTEKEAKQQLISFLSWLGRKNGFLPESNLSDIDTTEFAVMLRPEYEMKNRTFPCEYSMRIPFLCVHGNLTGDLRLASAPFIGLRFRLFKGDFLKNLFITQVQNHLNGKTVQQLSGFLPPRLQKIDEISVKEPAWKMRQSVYKPELPALSKIADPIDSKLAKNRFFPAWEREKESADLLKRLLEERANIVIVGENGTGKTTVLAEAVKRFANIKKSDSGPQFWQTSGQRLIAGMKYLGQWEERCEEVIQELEEIDGVLCAENLLDLVQVGGTGPVDSVASFFAPYLRSGELRLIAEATPSEIDACRRLLPGFADGFQVLTIESLERIRVLSLFKRMGNHAQKNKNIEIDKDVFDLIYRMFSRFYPGSRFPGKAARFFNLMIDHTFQKKEKKIKKKDVTAQFIKQTGLPDKLINDELPLSPDEIFKDLTSEVIGQDKACLIAADIIATFKAGLNDPERPTGVLMFCGPTGVGKTQLAKSITNFCFGHGEEKNRMIRLDMSEYSTYGAADRLIGSSFGTQSEMITKIRQQPFSVLLFDEIEKAAPEVFDILLNILDEGRFTDTFGKDANFKAAIIIMTSNLGVSTKDSVGFDSSGKNDFAGEIKSFFRPEFFNRIDEIVAFKHLSKDSIAAITKKELKGIADREGIKKRKIALSWSDNLVKHLSKIGYNRHYGARNLQRTIEEKVATPIARYLLANQNCAETAIKLDLDQKGDVLVLPYSFQDC